MANSFLEFIDNTLGTDFNTPPYDPSKGRDKMIKVIDKAAQQYEDGITKGQRSWRLGHNDAVSFSPRLAGSPVIIGGEEINYVPADRFFKFLSGLKTAVKNGDLDEQIREAIEKDVSTTTRRGASSLSSKARPDDPEWMAKFTAKYGPAPSDDHVPNAKGNKWVNRKNQLRGQKAKGVA